jgi:hypothetical protein
MVPAISDRDFILQQVVQLLATAEGHNDSNLILQLALTELVKQVMRSLAQATDTEAVPPHLLPQAVQMTLQLLEAQTATAALPVDLSPYFERINRSQRWVAKEMTALSLQLRHAQGEVSRTPRIVHETPVPFWVLALGTWAAPEGWLAQPLAPCRLQLEALRRDYAVRGQHAPWEVTVDEITFIVESDGSIITFLEGFPDSLLAQAGADLEQLAQHLYAPLVVS